MIYYIYPWYIPGIYFDVGILLVYTWYIPGIYRLYANVTELDTWWLVLRGRTGPHSSRASCDDISRPCDYSDFITARAPTARILALGHVGMQGALWTENRLHIPFLTSTAYKAMVCDGRCRIHAVNDNGTEEAGMLRSKHPSSYLCTQPALVHC